MGNLIRIINGRRNLKQIVVAVMGVDSFALMAERSFEEMQRHFEYNKILNYWNNLALRGLSGLISWHLGVACLLCCMPSGRAAVYVACELELAFMGEYLWEAEDSSEPR